MGGHISPTLDNAIDISIRSSPGQRLEQSVRMWMEVILFPSTIRRPMTSCIHFPGLLLIITTTPGLEQGGLTSTVTGDGVMEAHGTTATGALINPLIWELMIMVASMEAKNMLRPEHWAFGTTQTIQMMIEGQVFFANIRQVSMSLTLTLTLHMILVLGQNWIMVWKESSSILLDSKLRNKVWVEVTTAWHYAFSYVTRL